MSRTESYTVRSFDVGPRSRLTVRGFFNYLQESAGLHAEELGLSWDRLTSEGFAWVLHRVRMKIHSVPRLFEPFTVETWPSAFQTVQAHRDFLVRNSAGDLLAEATSIWLVIRLDKHKLVRLPRWIRDVPVPDHERVLGGKFEILDAPETIDHTATFDVRQDDLDVLGHVNNSRFAAFVAECLPEPDSRQLTEIDILYRAESLYRDRIVAQSQLSNGAFRHHLVREGDQTLLVQARTRWQDYVPAGTVS